MDSDKLNFLPPWRDDDFLDNEDEEDWKRKKARESARALYLKWREIFALVFAFAENLADEPEEGKPPTDEQTTQKLIYENAMIIAPKIMGGAFVNFYVLQMENAATIRTNARQLMEQINSAVLMGFAEESYKKAIEKGMNEFRLLFKNWVSTFQKDDFEDEWGLFT